MLHSPHKVSGQRKKKIWIKVLFFFLPLIAASALLSFIIRFLWFSPVTLGCSCMENTYKKNSRVFIAKADFYKLKRGNVVQIKRENMSDFCRVIALEGETVRLLHGEVFVNGRKVRLPAPAKPPYLPEKISARDNAPQVSVRPDHIYCLHDKWENWQDSRMFGPVHKEQVMGRVIGSGWFNGIK